MVSGLGVFGAHLIGTALHDDLPMFSQMALLQRRWTCSVEWDTNRTVMPYQKVARSVPHSSV